MISTYQSYAKLNLFLHVTGKREDGYHELYSLMTKISLCDDLGIDFSTSEISVACNHSQVPSDASNLAYKAAILFYDHLNTLEGKEREKGLYVRIKKKIPPGGGLGGGSSNAATVLTALNEYYQNPFSKSQLMELGLQLGADVPFFIFDKTAIVTGIGEQLEACPDLLPYHVLLCDPGVAASTVQVFTNFDFRLTKNQKYNKKTGLNVRLRGQVFDVREYLHNDLEEPALRLYPRIRSAKEEMELLLQRKVHMTGSGSSLFTLFSEAENAKSAFTLLNEKWKESGKRVFLSSF